MTHALATIPRPDAAHAVGVHLEDACEVILHNDELNTMEHVVTCLMRVFVHSEALAVKIMLEAHVRGQAIAEVEGESTAIAHRDQLHAFGLRASVKKV